LKELLSIKNAQMEAQTDQEAESHIILPNRYRDRLVQIGSYICPDSHEISGLVSQLFFNMNQIEDPIIKAIYFHHELIRIHPFIDGNGRTTGIAKNWILMYHLYPPIFIRDEEEKKEYITTLSNSFKSLNNKPAKWNESLDAFFKQEIRRIKDNAILIYNSVNNIGKDRE
jgi:Fic family protein